MIRDEAPGDEAAIAALTARAFADAPHSDGTESEIVACLRADNDLALSLVAEEGGALVGHAAFSPIAIDGRHDGWFGLGPVSVAPERQARGLGSALIRHGLARLRATGARGCVVLGDPAYYRRFGFAHDPRLRFPGPPSEYFQRLAFAGPGPSGVVTYAPAFSA